MKFTAFVEAFSHEPDDEAARELAFELIGQVPDWDRETALEWLEQLQRRDVGRTFFARMPDFDGIAVEDFELSMLEAVLARLAKLREPFCMDVDSQLILEAISNGATIDIPRRYLIDLYKAWIELDYVSRVGNYMEQAMKKCTPGERIEITKLLQATEGYVSETFLGEWVKRTIPDIPPIEPGLLPSWINVLEDTHNDPEANVLAGHYRTLRERMPSPDEPPHAILEYMDFKALDQSRCKKAKQALDVYSREYLNVPKVALERTIERDMTLLSGPLPRHMEAVICHESKELLQDFQRLETAGGSSLLSACAHLTLAIELQLKWALSRDRDEASAAQIRMLTLTALAKFLESPGTISILRHLKVTCPPDEKTLRLLRRAGWIRNKLHHEAPKIRDNCRLELRRMTFASDVEAPRLLEKIAGLRTEAQGE